MIIGDRENESELLAVLPSLRSNKNEWQVFSVILRKNCEVSKKGVVKTIMSLFKNNEGIIYDDNDTKIVCLVRIGMAYNYDTIKRDFETKLPGHTCRIMIRPPTDHGLKHIHINILHSDSEDTAMNMYDERKARKHNIIMVADDDKLVRKTMKSLIGSIAQVIEVEDGDKAVVQYLNHNPDVLFLDIHMPGMSGLDAMDKIIDMDPDAYIVILSADSVKDNILSAVNKGALGFLGKPTPREKVMEYINQSITVS